MGKKEILEQLRRGEGYVSGQYLCEKLGVSRTAIWKQIKQLQSEGYEIEAVPNRGYAIKSAPDVMTGEEVESRLTTQWVGRPTLYFAQIDSTNIYCKKAAEDGAGEGMLVIADEQTKGRGRRGRDWSTKPGGAIAMTLLLRPEIAPERTAMITLITGMALVAACRELYDLPVGIKWPNDVVVSGKKLSGTLTEMSIEEGGIHYIVVGTGINVNDDTFPEEISQTATSLYLETGKRQNRSELIAVMMGYFEQYYEKFLETEDLSLLRETYHDMLLNLGQQVRVLEPGNEYDGVAEGIDSLGELLVRRKDGTLTRVYAGEVSVRGIYGYV